MFQRVLEDLSVHREGLAAQGFWALQIYRFGHFAVGIPFGPVRVPLRVVHYFFLKLSEILFGICIPPKVRIGRRLRIEHFGGIVLHGLTQLGDDCVIRQGVTIGNRYLNKPTDAPKIGNRVNIGAGAKLLGAITIGDDVTIGANAVVLTDVPAEHVAVGIPAQIKPRRSLKAHVQSATAVTRTLQRKRA